jgi:amino acid transporter
MTKLVEQKGTINSLAVILVTLTTTIGAVLFLNLGFALSNVSFWGIIVLIGIAHLITIPTAFSVAEISTSQQSQGSIIYSQTSQTYGYNIGGSIGLMLFLVYSISIAFFAIAFSYAFTPLLQPLAEKLDLDTIDNRYISVPLMILMYLLMKKRSGKLSIKLHYLIAFLLLVVLGFMFTGKSMIEPADISLRSRVVDAKGYFVIFSIIFPAFIGFSAVTGYFKNLKNPTKTLPEGLIVATFISLALFLCMAYKLVTCISIDDLYSNPFAILEITKWKFIVPVGLGLASLVAMFCYAFIGGRTLHAMGTDNIFPFPKFNQYLTDKNPKNNIPSNAIRLTVFFAFFFVLIGNLEFAARVITLFAVTAFGAICILHLLKSLAADPSYRPLFKSRWYISFFGALASVFVFFMLNPTHIFPALLIIGYTYYRITKDKKEGHAIVTLFKGSILQLSYHFQSMSKNATKADKTASWKPYVICVSDTVENSKPSVDLLRWFSHNYGFSTYIHVVKGFLSKETFAMAEQLKIDYHKVMNMKKNRIHFDALISPSVASAVAQAIQLPGISGKRNNMLMFQYNQLHPQYLAEPVSTMPIASAANYDICILGSGEKAFLNRKEIHVWNNYADYENARLMLLLSYILLDNPEWSNATLKFFSLIPEAESEWRKQELLRFIKNGKIPIAPEDVKLVINPNNDMYSIKKVVSDKSAEASLTLIGFTIDQVKEFGVDIFAGIQTNGNLLFVNSHLE